MGGSEKRSDEDSALVKAGRFGALGIEFAGTVVAGVISGYYLDLYVGTAPLFTLVLTLAGMGGALYRLMWMLKRYAEQTPTAGRGSRSNNGDGSDTNQ